ncbi:uncharacterized protein [Triticum aestivum]|uniref:uncharacterized protein isoform X2 n=1 Tax=Triticum aestivum TaxID=4565 RepID=UPI001D021D17|nr:uncharacterized protein LOC123072218 isoform X2 [Triticum aestivum]
MWIHRQSRPSFHQLAPQSRACDPPSTGHRVRPPRPLPSMAPLPQPMPNSLFPHFHGSRSGGGGARALRSRWSEARHAASAPSASSQLATRNMAAMNGKKKAVHKTTATDDKRLQRTLKSVGVNTVLGIEEVSIVKDDVVIQFRIQKCKNPSLQTPGLSVEHHGLKIPLRRLSPNGCADRPVPLTN